MPVRNIVLYPRIIHPLMIGRPRSVAAAQKAMQEQRPIGILMQRDPDLEDPTGDDLYRVGTISKIHRYVAGPDDTHNLVCEGVQRFRLDDIITEHPLFTAATTLLPEPDTTSPEVEARFIHLKRLAVEAMELLTQPAHQLISTIQSTTSPGALADLVAAYLDIKPEEKQEILETIDLSVRLDKVLRLLSQRIEVLRLSHEIGHQTKVSLNERQREVLLREQMETIRRQLGENDGRSQEIAELSEALTKAHLPPEVEEQALRELHRYERMPEGAMEAGMIRTYLDWLIALPWALPEEKPIDIAEARRVLDEDHFGLEKIKQRIIEYLAVLKLAPNGKAPILCFVGPPGVGKTSLGQSIARAMGRPFGRVSLGGVHDEAEIRGHRRTYIGAMPGNIIQAIRKAGSRDCVMMLDEIDKMGRGVQGDPSAAMLEVLDPEQNATFRDNYLSVPFDLSRVVFIATANMLDTIPGPLRDRMEIITLAGYTDEEKLEIARRYLVRRQLEANGLREDRAQIDDEALRQIIRGYTREAGVRHLEREIGRVLRHAAVQIVEDDAARVHITADDLLEILGPPRFEGEVAMRVSVPGVATGLAWTPVGGDILFIEATKIPGKGRLILTGQLGDVMRESAQTALSLVKSRSLALGIDAGDFENNDIHIHVPAGATPKDGPSAGVTIFTALVSLLTSRTVRSDTAMTGEISLRGLVLPVGGIKEKVVAAARAGIARVMLPARNRSDSEDIPLSARNQIEFIWLERVDEAIMMALEDLTTNTAETAPWCAIVPPAGPHDRPALADPYATPGTGALPTCLSGDEADPGTG
jgi:ATP-dependent Lon protease